MTKSTIFIIVGIMLLGLAIFGAETIPLEANRDYIDIKSIPLQSVERQILFIKACERRRLLQNFYLGASGLICLAGGILAFPHEKKAGIPV
jgi:hypothetical protein